MMNINDMIAARLTRAEVRAIHVARWGEDVVAANEADVARRINRPRKGEPFHPIHNTGSARVGS